MKKKLKSEILEKRNSLSKEQVKCKSERIKEKLFLLPEFKKSKNILAYVSFNNEVDTIDLIKKLLKNRLKNGKNIIVPYVEKGNPLLQLSELRNFEDLEPKTFGILEPKMGKIRKADAKDVELALVPGVAFDRRGHRIGYGFGYYDRFLKKLNKNAVKIGICYEFQLIGEIPEERHDVPIDIVITENRVLKVR